MAHLVGRLTAAKVKKPGMYADGAGLYLHFSGDGEQLPAKSWIFRFTLRGCREMGLGSFSIFGLVEVRAKATKFRRPVYEVIDPIEARRAHRAQAALKAAAALTFKECTK
ncbi:MULTISPECIES: Arm DNA-binding domain-containing protein [unclassified Bradyrhizobium]|uniref:Arm DNA-binding domain-containing protein n=1 Tax=unclassified Bradyrhizobium TaxID=2631580 RepID=UPI0028E73B56|nr:MULTISPECIES: Arm DNA-binding domain-containing protein [unclassified Bradyrhizobium]